MFPLAQVILAEYNEIDMYVRDVMQTSVIAIPRSSTWRDVVAMLIQHKISGLPVVDEEGRVVGIVSEKDLFRAIYPTYQDWYQTPDSFLDFNHLENEIPQTAGRRVEEFMSKRLITATLDMPILKVGAIMMATGVHRIPVVDDGRLVGVVGRRQIFRAILHTYFHVEED